MKTNEIEVIMKKIFDVLFDSIDYLKKDLNQTK